MTCPSVETIRNSLRSDGFAVATNIVSRSETSDFITRAEAIFNRQSAAHSPGSPKLLDLFERHLPDRYAMLTSPAIRALVSALVGDEALLISEAIPFRLSPAWTPAGADKPEALSNSHLHDLFFIEPEHSMLVGWLALEDVQPEAGPMWVWPRSHTRNTQRYDHILQSDRVLNRDLETLRERGASGETWNSWARRLQQATTLLLEQEMAEQNAQRIPILINAGDLLLFDRRLVHGTLPPKNSNLTRWSMVTRYQGRGTIERGWSTGLGSSSYEAARRKVPPVTYEMTRCSPEHAWRAVNPWRDAMTMFWETSLGAP
jgi:hypothetical protein